MRAHNVIILTSGQVRPDSGRELNELVGTICQLKKNPILVLGPDGDELLRTCDAIEACEIVFDPNFDGGFFSGLKAGLFATHGAAFVVSLNAPILATDSWLKLESSLLSPGHESGHVLRPLTQSKNDEMTFPFLVTAQGVAHLKNRPAQSPWPPGHEVIFQDVAVNGANEPSPSSL